jgi:hypothetical protein
MLVGWGEQSEPQQQTTALALRSRNLADLMLGFAALTPTYEDGLLENKKSR